MSDPWDDLLTEARAFGAWVGVDTRNGFYGGWAVDGDHLYDDWDESEMPTASGATVEEVIEDLIGIAIRYRERRDAERAEMEADDLPAPLPENPR